jgi:ribonuclease D
MTWIPENAWRRLQARGRPRLKYLSVYKSVAAWRERTAQLRDQPRGRILKDDAIDELASPGPDQPGGRNTLRPCPRASPAPSLALICWPPSRRPWRDPEATLPCSTRLVAANPASAGSVVELFKVLLKARAEEAGVASKLIATVSDLEMIAADDEANTPALVGWRREAFGLTP